MTRSFAATIGAIFAIGTVAAPAHATLRDGQTNVGGVVLTPNDACHPEIGIWGATHGVRTNDSSIPQGTVFVISRCPGGATEQRHFIGALCKDTNAADRWTDRHFAQRSNAPDEVDLFYCAYTDDTLKEMFAKFKESKNRHFAIQMVDRLHQMTHPLVYSGATPWEQVNGRGSTSSDQPTAASAADDAKVAALKEALRKEAHPTVDTAGEPSNSPEPQLTQVNGTWTVAASLSTPEEASKLAGRPIARTELVPDSWRQTGLSSTTERGIETCGSWVEIWQWNGRTDTPAVSTTPWPGPNVTPIGNNKYEVAITQCPKKGPKHQTQISCARANFDFPTLDPHVGVGNSPAVHETYTGASAKGSEKSHSSCTTWSRYTNHRSLEKGQGDISTTAEN